MLHNDMYVHTVVLIIRQQLFSSSSVTAFQTIKRISHLKNTKTSINMYGKKPLIQ